MPKSDYISSTCNSTVVALTTALVITTSSIDTLPLPLRNYKFKTKNPICRQLENSIDGVSAAPFMHGFFANTIISLNSDKYGSFEEDVVICISPKKSYSLKARIVKINKPGPNVYGGEAHGLIT